MFCGNTDIHLQRFCLQIQIALLLFLYFVQDVESVWLARDAARELGGTRAVNCKSGKDRTAMEIALSFTHVSARAASYQGRGGEGRFLF